MAASSSVTPLCLFAILILMSFRATRHLNQRTRIFIDWLVEMFGELDSADQVS